MYMVISPSKTQDFKRNFETDFSEFAVSEFNQDTEKISEIMKDFSSEDLGKIMKISEKLSNLNYERFQYWNGDFEERKINLETGNYNFSPAVFSFLGDVYRGFDLENYQEKDFLYAKNHLGIISGFYGLLSPTDFIKPYRLEMGTRLSFELEEKKYKNLYEFWEEKITSKLNEILETEEILVNLASHEYFKVVNQKKILGEILNIDFKVKKNGVLKTIGIYAKRARGEMSNWVIQNQINSTEDLKFFKGSGWEFHKKISEKNKLVFCLK